MAAGIPRPASSGELAERPIVASAEDGGSDEEGEPPTSRTRHGRTYNAPAPAALPKREKPVIMLEVRTDFGQQYTLKAEASKTGVAVPAITVGVWVRSES